MSAPEGMVWSGRKGVALLMLASILTAGVPLAGPALAFPATSGGTKPMTVLFHYSSSAESAGGVSTNYLASTSTTFQGVKNHDVKSSGQPKMQIDFYTYPALAGTLHLAGEWQVVVFANSTALHPANWNLEFWERTSSGSILWDSGVLTPTVLGGPSGNNGFVDAPIYGYTLTIANLSRTLSAGNTLEVEVSVNTGSTVPLSVWYDSPQEPSRMILPSSDYMRISGVSTEDANGTSRTVFFTFWPDNQRNVSIRTTVTDPFGGYDVYRVAVSVKDPSGTWVVANATMTRVSGTSFSYSSSFSHLYHYAGDAPKGNYTVVVMALDNNAQNHFSHFGTYSPYADVKSSRFSIGLQYPVAVKVFDTHGALLGGAKVAFFSGEVQYAAGYTGQDGVYNVTLFTGDFVARVWWEGVQVLSQNISVRGATSVNLTAAVYYPTFKFVDDVQTALPGALVFVHFPNGSASVLPYTSGAAGTLTLSRQPEGNYTLLVLFEGVQVADNVVPVASDGPFVTQTMVFRLRVTVEDSGGAPLNGSSVLVSSPGRANGGAYGYLVTGKNGQANFSLPVGNYTVTAEYHGVYDLSPYSNRTTVTVSLSHDTSLTIKMANLPPPLWLTLGFQLGMIVLVVVVVLVVYLLLRRRSRSART